MNKMLRLTAVIALIFALACAGFASAEIFAPHGEGQIGISAVVASDEVTIYEKANESSKAVQKVPFGNLIILMEQKDGWAYCTLTDDVDGKPAGWVSTEGLIVDPCWFMTREETPAYADKDAASEVLARFDADMIMPVLKIEGDWIGVNANGQIGWINVPDAANTPDARFDAVIMIEGMEETVQYEHAVNEELGIAINYEYKLFERFSEEDRETFISVYDDPENPSEYFDISYRAEAADAVLAQESAALKEKYEISVSELTLNGAGKCTYIDASADKGGKTMPEVLRSVYIIPAQDGCYVVSTRCYIESAEGFGVRVRNMINTITLLDGEAE